MENLLVLTIQFVCLCNVVLSILERPVVDEHCGHGKPRWPKCGARRNSTRVLYKDDHLVLYRHRDVYTWIQTVPHKTTRHDGPWRPVRETTCLFISCHAMGIHPFTLIVHVGNCG